MRKQTLYETVEELNEAKNTLKACLLGHLTTRRGMMFVVVMYIVYCVIRIALEGAK